MPAERPHIAPDLPELFVVTDAASLRGQARFFRLTRLQLVLLVVAGGAGVFDLAAGRFDVSALISCTAFLGAAGLRFLLLRGKPHRAWYEGRAAAESLKTLGWRYSVAGEPFSAGVESAERLWEEQAGTVLEELPELAGVQASATPTPSMIEMRAQPLDVRREAYRVARIRDQIDWYTAKAVWHERRSRGWGFTILGLQILAAGGALLKGVGILRLDLFGLAAAIVASFAAWAEARQHGTIATGYRVAASELRRIEELAASPRTEEQWAKFVAEAEHAISREHTMWKASNSERDPVGLA